MCRQPPMSTALGKVHSAAGTESLRPITRKNFGTLSFLSTSRRSTPKSVVKLTMREVSHRSYLHPGPAINQICHRSVYSFISEDITSRLTATCGSNRLKNEVSSPCPHTTSTLAENSSWPRN